MSEIDSRVVRCFAVEDEALVEEWPVALGVSEVKALVPGEEEIVEIEAALAARLIGSEPGPYSEKVRYFLEPKEPVTGE